MASLLVIGGSGFFGKSILDSFLRDALDPWNIDKVIIMSRNAERMRSEFPFLLSSRVELYNGDITNATSIPEANYVIHAAASSDASNYREKPAEERNNIQAGMLNYAKLAKTFHRDSKILYVSSGAVYGALPGNLERVPEDFSPECASEMHDGKLDYTLAKRDAEKVAQGMAEEGLAVSIARCFAFVGPWLPLDQHFAIGNFIADGLAERPITVKARHKVYRSYMYADDLVESLMRVVNSASSKCPIYNVGSDEGVLMGDLAREVASVFGQKAEVPEITEQKIDRYVPDISRLRNQLGFDLRFDLRAAIVNTIREIKGRNR